MGRRQFRWSRGGDVHLEWFQCLVTTATFLLLLAAIGCFLTEPWYISEDSALFQHAGWYILEGATPYVDFWDLKPPLIYAVTTGLAALSGGNMAVLHLLSILTASLAVIAGVAFVGLLTYQVTDHPIASLVAGLSVFLIPSLYTFPSAGIRPKYLAFAFGVGALVLAVDDRPAASGAASAIGAGFWQLAAPIAIIVTAMAWQRGRLAGVGRTIGGALIVAVLVVVPFVATGLAIPLFLETVLAPVYGVERYTVAGRFLQVIVECGPGLLAYPLGVFGWTLAVRRHAAAYWWLPAGGMVYTVGVFLEFQGALEAILLVPFVAIGIGVFIAEGPDWATGRSVGILVAVLAVTSLLWVGGALSPLSDPVERAYQAHEIRDQPALPPEPADMPPMEEIYWDQQRPEICHYRMSEKQRWYAVATGESLEAEHCGAWPFEAPPREWAIDRAWPLATSPKDFPSAR